jgi:hypothetical protein
MRDGFWWFLIASAWLLAVASCGAERLRKAMMTAEAVR